MNRLLAFILSFATVALCQSCTSNQTNQIGKSLPRTATPTEIKASAEALIAHTDSLPDVTLQSLMILKNGKVVYETWLNGGADTLPHVMHSVSKSFTATAIGMLVDDGKLKVTDKVVDLFPDDLPDEVSDNLNAMTVRDLLTMNCGHEVAPEHSKLSNWTRTFLAQPVTKTPGTWYCYNSMATYMLSAIVQKLSGEKLVDFLTPRLFEPLGISKPKWEESPQGINVGGWGLYITTEDMAKFGQLFLQKGKWNGKQLISEAWVAEASAWQVPSVPAGTRPDEVEAKGLTEDNCAWLLGYGYQMWRCPQNAYRADGAFGQYIIVMPDNDAVIAVTANSPNLQAELSSVYNFLFPVLSK